jgi:hypothetical protein
MIYLAGEASRKNLFNYIEMNNRGYGMRIWNGDMKMRIWKWGYGSRIWNLGYGMGI